MSKTFGNDDPAVAQLITSLYAPEDERARDIRARAAAAGLPDIHVSPLDARHLEVLTRAIGARKAVEIGTLAGYSGVAILRGLGATGRLETCELEPAHARVAEETFRRAGFEGRYRIHVGPALERLNALQADGPFDLCFIDADKEGYAAYLDWAARNLRRGGLVIGDNAFLFGELVSPDRDATPARRSMHAFHERLATSGDFSATVLPTGEGLAVGVKL